jgi:hypothetical protein
MTASTPGRYLTERADRKTVLLARVATSTEHKKIEDMPGGLEEDKARVVVGPNKNNNKGKI